MNVALPEIKESVETLKKLMNKETVTYKKERLHALYLLKSGYATNRKQVAQLLGVARHTVGRWLKAYQQGGIEMMTHRDFSPGRHPLLSSDQLDQLKTELQKPNGFATYGEIQEFISETFGVSMSYKAVYSLVHDKWKAKPKVPRKSHKKKRAVDRRIHHELTADDSTRN
jgi:transposase